MSPAYAAVIAFVNKYLDPGYLSDIRMETLLRKDTSLLEESAKIVYGAALTSSLF